MKTYQESITAKICSFVRAYHSAYAKHKIYDDSLAYDLLGQNEYLKIGKLIEHNFNEVEAKNDSNYYFDKDKIAPVVERFLAPIPLSRLAFAKEKYETFLVSHQHKPLQFIVLGAGLDTFSLTNDNHQVEVYEFDHPNSFRYKLGRIETLNLVMPKNLHFVPIDFEKQSLSALLKESSIKPTVPTFITFLGVAYYLELDTLRQTLATLSSFFKGELTLVFDYPDETTKTSPTNSRVTKLAKLTSQVGEHMVDGFSYSQIQTLLLDTHFNLDEHLTPLDIDERYFKENSTLKAYENVHFISATL